MDELWSFVDHKGNKQWVWLAMDAETREIIGCHVGGTRSHAAGLSLSGFCGRTMAVFTSGLSASARRIYTDHWEAYETVIPSKRHFAVDKGSGLTSYIERVNNTPASTGIALSAKDTVVLEGSWRTILVPSGYSFTNTTAAFRIAPNKRVSPGFFSVLY